MKRLLCTLLAIVVLFMIPAQPLASASEQTPSTRGVPQISEDPRYYAVYPDGTKIVAAYRSTASGPALISKEEFAAQLRSTPPQPAPANHKKPAPANHKEPEPTLQYSPPYCYAYEEWGWTEQFETRFRRRVSDYVYNQTPNEVLTQVPYSITQSTVYSYNLSEDEKSAVQFAIWMDPDQTYSHTSTPYCRLDPYHKAWVEAWPSMQHTWGFLSQYDKYLNFVWSFEIHIYIPTQVDGRLFYNSIVLEAPI